MPGHELEIEAAPPVDNTDFFMRATLIIHFVSTRIYENLFPDHTSPISVTHVVAVVTPVLG